MTRAKPITAEDFEKFDPEWRYDLVRGELIPMPPMPGAEHGRIVLSLSAYVSIFVEEHDLGECFAAETRFSIERDPDTVLAPDLAFVAKERLPETLPTGFLELAPDLILEVRSPSDREKEAEAKMLRWQRACVRLGWEIDPKTRLLTVYRPDRPTYRIGIDDTLTGEDVLPGFSLPLRRLFRNPRG